MTRTIYSILFSLFILGAVPRGAVSQPLFGYNQVTGQTELIINNAELAGDLATMLQEEDHKVLRFPGGTEARSYTYDPNLVWGFSYFAYVAEVSQLVYVINMNDIPGAIRTARDLQENFEIILFEVGNEEYLHARPKDFGEALLLLFSPRGFYMKKGEEYGRKFLAIQRQFEEAGFNAPMSASYQVPNDVKNRAWFDGVEGILGAGGHATVHLYPGVKDSRHLARTDRWLEFFTDKTLHLTENNSWFGPRGKNAHLAHTDLHRDQLVEAVAHWSAMENVSTLLLHCLFGEEWVRYERYKGTPTPEGWVVEDMFKDWSVWPF